MEGLYTGPPFLTRTRKHPDERPSDNRTRNQGDVTLLITGHSRSGLGRSRSRTGRGPAGRDALGWDGGPEPGETRVGMRAH